MDISFLPLQVQIFIDYVSFSGLLQLYLISIALLVIGMIYEVWSRVSLSFIKDMPLSAIETTHPYLPSFGIIVTTLFCLSALLIITLQTVTGLEPFDQPAAWIGIGVVFLVCGVLGLLTETRKKGAHHLISAFIVGTVFVLVPALLRFVSADTGRLPVGLLQSGVLLLVIVAVWRVLKPVWSVRFFLMVCVVFCAWIPFILSR